MWKFPRWNFEKKAPVLSNVKSRWWQLKYFFIFIPNPGEMIQFDEHIFQMGCFNHKPGRTDIFIDHVIYQQNGWNTSYPCQDPPAHLRMFHFWCPKNHPQDLKDPLQVGGDGDPPEEGKSQDGGSRNFPRNQIPPAVFLYRSRNP